MQDYEKYLEEEFVIYNAQLTLRDFVWIDRLEAIDNTILAFLEEPYEMVKFDLDELIFNGKISFESCEVYTTQKWEENQIKIQRDYINQRKNQKEFNETIKNHTNKKTKNDKKHRELLCLPLEGNLKVEEIKIAYRKVVKRVHPDVGGSHEKFIEITLARDILLNSVQ